MSCDDDGMMTDTELVALARTLAQYALDNPACVNLGDPLLGIAERFLAEGRNIHLGYFDAERIRAFEAYAEVPA
jgi:hypothetical protein